MDRRTIISKCFVLIALVVVIAGVQAVSLRAQDDNEEEERAKYQPYRDYGEDWRLASLFGLSSEDGVLVGTGAIVYKFGFRVFPYIYRMELVGGLTLKTARWKFRYTAKFPAVGKNLSIDLLAYASELEVRNFYGIGNNTQRNEALEKNDFYRVASRQYFIQPLLKYKSGKHTSLGFGVSFKHFEVRQKANRFLTTALINTLGRERSVLGTGVSVSVTTLDTVVAPRRGIALELSAWNYPGLFNPVRPFQRYKGDIRGFVSAGPVTAGLHFAGETLEGDFPFFELAFLNLRGYNLNRFSGDASLLGTAELRFELFKLKLLVPSQVGMFIFGDAGRVYVGGTSPGGWHSDAGAGLSIAPISPDMTFSISIASSVEGIFLNGGFGFSF